MMSPSDDDGDDEKDCFVDSALAVEDSHSVHSAQYHNQEALFLNKIDSSSPGIPVTVRQE